jgi:peptide/nickel transport system ATP-binding protein
MKPLLELHDLYAGFGQSTVVGGIRLTVQAGETLGLVGASGSGKTLTALSVMRLLPPGAWQRGDIDLYDGDAVTRVASLPEKSLRALRGKRMAMIFQDPATSLNPVLSCGAQVAEAVRRHRQLTGRAAQEATLELLRKVRLDDPERMAASYPYQLSGGQQQRLVIAMAISGNPALLIADEPTSSLDVTVQASILALLRDLQQESGMGILFITHDLAVVEQVAHRVAVMDGGQIVEEGSCDAVLQHPQQAVTRRLLAMRPAPPEAVPPSLPPGTPILQVRHLSKSYTTYGGLFTRTTGDVAAVNDVSFDLYAGETFGLVGESGSGKSTLARLLVRIADPGAGDITFRGADWLGAEGRALRKQRRDIQVIFQNPYASLNPRMTVGEAIAEPIRVHGLASGRAAAKEKALDLLRRVGLEAAHYDRYPNAFSGGQRQRICIARALAVQPRLLICDECVSSLDVAVQAQVLDLLRRLKQEEGLTILFISHDLNVVRSLSDRIAVLYEGRIVESGDAETLFRSPKNPYTQRLLAAIPGAGRS